MAIPSVRRAIVHLVEGEQPGGVDGVVLQGGDSRGVVEHEVGDAVQQRQGSPHHFGLRVNMIRCAVRSRLEMMNGPADGPGPLS